MTPSTPSPANRLPPGEPLPIPRARKATRQWIHRPLERVLQRLLDTMACGSLVVELPCGRQMTGSGASPGPQATLVLHSWRPLWRMLVGGDLGLAEGYRRGEWSSPDLVALLESGIRNEAHWSSAIDAGGPVRWARRLFHLRRANTRSGSRRNIAFHYDMGNDFYAQWLDPSMLYSSAIYRTGAETLEQAQSAKLARIIKCLAPNADEHVLEIGCGWGALASALAGQSGARVTGLTLSAEQLRFARQRMEQEALTPLVDLRLQDYRDVEGTFDHIVSIEMLEAVGERYWPTYFDTLRERLRPGGRAVIQVITIADSHFERYRAGTDFIQRHIFPGGMLPSPSTLADQAAHAGLTIQARETFGPSYAATLAEWRHRFLRAWPAIEPLGFDAPFRRLWEYYLCYCEAGFRTGRIDVGLYTLVHGAPRA
ncbi:SAM-dependent methyltransferase [Paracidovorax anthurii]|uniref:Cyclopropane-fatty-acyl-phospholipid synthase n=1 Tax=Paracidovorax anthurii TaxID=78229 RepID=A0A328Z8N5_9BURK|nr:cyclopropane-fatty-acyl-phospholipid synthase family protein [Paracidovorax anthurii]RAR81042.1 cyclopropane-fatty-acyl-phospholipid synthase [Paracidovorax anthurii]